MDLKTIARFAQEGVYTPDALIAHDADDLLGKTITLASGQNLTRGAVLGRITASGKYVLSATAAVDGSQVPSVVLCEDTNATGGDAACNAYFSGVFNVGALVLGAGHTTQTVTDALRNVGIQTVTVQGGV